MNKDNIYKLLRYTAILGNIAYFLWILSNGIDEGFRASGIQVVSYVGILFLLVLDVFLLYRKK